MPHWQLRARDSRGGRPTIRPWLTPSSCCATGRAPGTRRTCSRAGTTCPSPTRARRGGRAGRTMAAAGLWFDTSHTSLLTRAVDTADLALAELGQPWLPVAAVVAPERAPLRRPPGQGQDGRRPSSTAPSRPTCGGGPTTCRPRPCRPTSPEHPANDPRYRWLAPDVLPGVGVPEGRGRPGAALLVRRRRPPAARPA